MSYKGRKHSSNNQNWVFYHPTVGDSWTHLIEKECWENIESNYEAEETDLETDRPKKRKSGQKLVILAMASSTLLLGIAAWLQIPKLHEANININEEINITEKIK